MTKKERYEKFLSYFSENMPIAESELDWRTPFELTVAVILSAQCTDKRVNIITPDIFKLYPTAEMMAEASADDIFDLIKSCSYPNNKAKHLKGMADMLVKDFNGAIPQNLEELQKLPGVGRKTANVVGSVAFDIPAMPVDTHVFRVSQRIGLVSKVKKPLECETQLVKHLPKEILGKAHHWIILHGRYVCVARKPKCETCGIANFCKFNEQKIQKTQQ